MQKRYVNPMRYVLMVCVLAVSACAPDGLYHESGRALEPGRALVTVYLNAFGSSSRTVTFALEDLALVDGGAPRHVDIDSFYVDSRKASDRQLLIGAAVVDAGNYSGLSFRLAGVQVDGAPEGGEAPVLNLSFPNLVSLGAGDSVCLFVNWSLDEAASQSGRFVSKFSAQGQVMPLSGELIYVACDDIDTIYLVGTDRNRVAASVGLVGPLGSLRIDSERRRLYAVSGGARSIFVMDCDAHRFIDRIALPMTLAPRYMDLSDDGEFAYVTDAQTNRVIKVDLAAGVAAAQSNDALYAPGRVLFMKTDLGDLLAVGSPATRQIYILNAENLGLRQTLPAGLEPEGMFYDEGLLYACDRASDAVLVFSIRDGRQRAQIAVGTAPTHITAESGGRIYVSNTGEDSLSVIVSGQHTAFRRIPSGPGPFALTVSRHRQVLYAANRNDKKLTVLDLNSDSILSEIPLGGMPRSMDQKF